jgi:hypothetical protein
MNMGINHKTIWLAASIGMGVGVLAGLAYLMSGGQVIRELAPHWAALIFYPGFVAGEKAADLGWGVDGGKGVGVMSVGLTYAGIAVLIHLIGHYVKRKG